MSNDDAGRSDDTISLEVTTSRGQEVLEFKKTAKIEEVIAQIRDDFNLSGKGDFDLVENSDNELLEPEGRTLVSFGLEDGDAVTLSGGGRNV